MDFSPATVVTLYLSTKGNLKLLSKLQTELSAGSRVVSFCWPIESMKPSRMKKVDRIPIYLYEF